MSIKSFAFYPWVFLLLILFCFQTAFAIPTTPSSDFIDNKNGTVTHKTTGLTWMRCSMGQTWTGLTCEGTAATYTWDAAMALKSNFAGHSDWRLPNIAELQTIVERENFWPAINYTIFPNTPNTYFWSSSRNFGFVFYCCWYVSFKDGYDDVVGSSRNSRAVRLVRSSQTIGSLALTTPNSDFTDNQQDGTVTHKRTGLMWQRCSVGQTWIGSSCSGTASRYTYDTAIGLTSVFGGHNDWRVPNANELASIVEYGTYFPTINTAQFPNTPTHTVFWSFSPDVSDAYSAWTVSFDSGMIHPYYRRSNFAVRLVRGKWSYSSSPDLDITKASCRYVAPVYNKMWRLMKVKIAPNCGAVLRYHTWINATRPDNYTVSNSYSNRLAGIDSHNQLFNDSLQRFDDAVAIINTVLDPDLRRALTPSDYKLSTNIMKSKGIVASLAAGQTPFKRSTVYGRVLDKIFKDKIIAEGGSKTLCNLFFDDAADAASCGNEAAKVTACGLGLATEGWKGVSGCVLDATTSLVGMVNNGLDIFELVVIKQRLYGYILINDYLDAYFAKGTVQIPTDDTKLESDIQRINSLNLNNDYFGDYDMQFVKDGIREGINRTVMTSSNNVKLVESLRKILQN